jgi:hypothetical protein
MIGGGGEEHICHPGVICPRAYRRDEAALGPF